MLMVYIILNICLFCLFDCFVDICIMLLFILFGCFIVILVYFNEIIFLVFEEGLVVYIVVFLKFYIDIECICVIDGVISVVVCIRIYIGF